MVLIDKSLSTRTGKDLEAVGRVIDKSLSTRTGMDLEAVGRVIDKSLSTRTGKDLEAVGREIDMAIGDGQTGSESGVASDGMDSHIVASLEVMFAG